VGASVPKHVGAHLDAELEQGPRDTDRDAGPSEDGDITTLGRR